MSYLEFISDEELIKHVKKTLDTYGNTLKAIDLSSFNSNIVDPVKLTFDSKVYKKNIEQIITEEIVRQRDKTNTNAIGYFHQNIFKYISNCEVPAHGFDVIFSKKDKTKVYVELKNKHNTMNSSSSQKTYVKLSSKALSELSCECYLVEVIAKRSQNVAWSISLDGERTSCERVRRVSIDKFYEEITNDRYAFKKLCDILPTVIDEILEEHIKFEVEEDTVINELKILNKNMLKSIYLLAFSTYEGFDDYK